MYISYAKLEVIIIIIRADYQNITQNVNKRKLAYIFYTHLQKNYNLYKSEQKIVTSSNS